MSFDLFWEAYPRKVDKQKARKAWEKIPAGLVDVIVAAVQAQAQTHDWLKSYGSFIPYPASWLNGRRWEDETLSPTGNPEGKSPDWELGLSDPEAAAAANADPEVQAEIDRLRAKPGVARRLKAIEEAKKG
jgi:hypothetical protein